MARTAQEATRFTSTQPYASSRSPLSASTIALSKPAPPNETPSQKVVRLRNAARQAKLDQESTWDKIVLRGRVWADRAHKVTATGLILASVVATGFAALSFGEMILANRGKKAEWYKQQEASYQRALEIAKYAEANGTLTSDLALFLNKERAVEQAEEEKKRAGTFLDRAKRTLFGGLKMEETNSSTTGGHTRQIESENSPEPSQVMKEMADTQSRRMQAEATTTLAKTIPVVGSEAAEDSRTVDRRQPISGGPLDRMGQNAAENLNNATRSWFSWPYGS